MCIVEGDGMDASLDGLVARSGAVGRCVAMEVVHEGVPQVVEDGPLIGG